MFSHISIGKDNVFRDTVQDYQNVLIDQQVQEIFGMLPKLTYDFAWKFYGYRELFFRDMEEKVVQKYKDLGLEDEQICELMVTWVRGGMQAYPQSKEIHRLFDRTTETAEKLAASFERWLQKEGYALQNKEEFYEVCSMFLPTQKLPAYITVDALAYAYFRLKVHTYTEETRALLHATLGDFTKVAAFVTKDAPYLQEIFPASVHGIEKSTLIIMQLFQKAYASLLISIENPDNILKEKIEEMKKMYSLHEYEEKLQVTTEVFFEVAQAEQEKKYGIHQLTPQHEGMQHIVHEENGVEEEIQKAGANIAQPKMFTSAEFHLEIISRPKLLKKLETLKTRKQVISTLKNHFRMLSGEEIMALLDPEFFLRIGVYQE